MRGATGSVPLPCTLPPAGVCKRPVPRHDHDRDQGIWACQCSHYLRSQARSEAIPRSRLAVVDHTVLHHDRDGGASWRAGGCAGGPSLDAGAFVRAVCVSAPFERSAHASEAATRAASARTHKRTRANGKRRVRRRPFFLSARFFKKPVVPFFLNAVRKRAALDEEKDEETDEEKEAEKEAMCDARLGRSVRSSGMRHMCHGDAPIGVRSRALSRTPSRFVWAGRGR